MTGQLSPLELGAVILIALLVIKEAFSFARAVIHRHNGNPRPAPVCALSNGAILESLRQLHDLSRDNHREQINCMQEIRDEAKANGSKLSNALGKLDSILGIGRQI